MTSYLTTAWPTTAQMAPPVRTAIVSTRVTAPGDSQVNYFDGRKTLMQRKQVHVQTYREAWKRVGRGNE